MVISQISWGSVLIWWVSNPQTFIMFLSLCFFFRWKKCPPEKNFHDKLQQHRNGSSFSSTPKAGILFNDPWILMNKKLKFSSEKMKPWTPAPVRSLPIAGQHESWPQIFTDWCFFIMWSAQNQPLMYDQLDQFNIDTLRKTNIAMENPPFWWYLPGKIGIFMGELLVSGRVIYSTMNSEFSLPAF